MTMTEAQIGAGCGKHDTEDPVCARVVLMGEIVQLEGNDEEEARAMVFAKHPAMEGWHAHTYHVYELVVGRIRVLDYYGGYGFPSPDEYKLWKPAQT